ncbi:MAG: DUF3343 domain-containing protein [Oscillospiraceae bacterium]|nr:DUF3343 domain-containing protein [Oscillospiraceae bacterium]
MNYLATFHTHLSALRSHKRLTANGIKARQAPVPRVLSSSCGTCVLYEGDGPMVELLDGDLEAVYRKDGEGYQELFRKEE